MIVNCMKMSTRFHNFTGLPDDTYYLNATVWTTTGQSNNTETREYNIDTTSPLISPANNPYRSCNFYNAYSKYLELYCNRSSH